MKVGLRAFWNDWAVPSALLLAMHGAIMNIKCADAAEGDMIGPGYIHVIDGDTFHLDGYAIRLSGVDAPEIGALRSGWEIARMMLISLTENREVACRDNGNRSNGRVVADCFLQPEKALPPPEGLPPLPPGAVLVDPEYGPDTDPSKPWEDLAAKLIFLGGVKNVRDNYHRYSPYLRWTLK